MKINIRIVCFGSKAIQNQYIEQFRVTNNKRGLIYISTAILFLVHMKVNLAAILYFFFQVYSSVTFIPNLLCYHKYVILSSTCLEVYL